jgi:high affinity choline transporter 7
VFWPGLLAIGVFYGAVFAMGVWASRQGGKTEGEGGLEELILAGRSLPLWVGFLTMTATWVGGGYINGTAQTTYTSGILWGAQAGVGYALSLLFGGLVFARVMRRHNFATLVDPFERRYGNKVAALMMLPAVFAETLWSAAILVALGTTFATVLGVTDLTLAITVSASIAIGYTVLGGMRAVAYTDVIQLGFIAVGLGVALPFVINAAGGMGAVTGAAGTLSFSSGREAVMWSDFTLLLILGGIPWNVYFQRVLSAKNENTAAGLSIGAAVACLLMAIPPVLLGLAARELDWASVASPEIAELVVNEPTMVLPLLLRYAVPTAVGVIGLGAVAAAVMSSVDSSILSAASLVAWNGYRRLLAPDASAETVGKLVRGLVVGLGIVATVIALTVGNVSALWYLCGDVIYCVLFPQLAMALFDKRANWIGAVTGFGVSVFMRLGGGDATLGLPSFLGYPDWSADELEFPFRTMAMLCGFFAALIVSRLTASLAVPRPLGAVIQPSRATGGR